MESCRKSITTSYSNNMTTIRPFSGDSPCFGRTVPSQRCPNFNTEWRESFFHLSKRIAIYNIESREYIRDINFPCKEIHVWRIWRNEVGVLNALTDRGVFSFFAETGKCVMERMLPGYRWIQGIPLDGKVLFLVKEDLTIHEWSPTPEDAFHTRPISELRLSTSPKNGFLMDANPHLLAYVEEDFKGNAHLRFVRSENTWTGEYPSAITCLSVHPTENMIAIGDKGGKILVCSSVHSIAWSHDSILSGGREEVLIKWSFKHKCCIATVPRLGGIIRNIFLVNDLALLSLSNNSLQIFERTGLTKKGHLAGPDFESMSDNFVWFEPYESLVFSYGGTSLQFLNPRTRKEVRRLEIIQENKVSAYRDQVEIPPTLHFDVSSDYKWLATARKDDIFLKLSIWKFSLEDINPFSLTTQWTEPECLEDNVSIKFIQSKQQLIVLGTEMQRNYGKIDSTSHSHYWVKSFTYKNHTPSAVSSSEDGSVLAIAFKNSITLWRNDGVHFGLITSLSNSSTVTSLLFGRGRNAGVLFSSTDSLVFVWDVLHMKLRRKIPFTDPVLVSMPDKRIAVKDNNGLFVYDANGMRSKIYDGLLESVIFCSSSSSLGMIHCYFLTYDGNIGRIKWSRKEEEEDENKENIDSTIKDYNPYTSSALSKFKTIRV
ncbi:NAN1 [Lepeophtheirus salmonis]|uniref:NAN1 n=1 Tax=Lepeophtheirus salmonis TaxID=72036 RepID=A0A7R8HCI3_LEPSM|nr:NAN1 [Lepeophtheirus salmonis]CAF3005579.1 NAN1 [Lepeophtheirus salmonis]